MPFAVWSGLVAAGFSATLSLSQVRHIRAQRSTAGLSDVSWLLLALTFSSWLIWGVLHADPYQIATNAVSLAGALWVLWYINSDTRIPKERILGAAGAVSASFALQLLGGTPGSLLAVFAITALIRIRQQRALAASLDISGVAIAPWIISSVAQLVCFSHGLAAGKIVVAAHAPFAILTNLALIAAVQRRRAVLETPVG